MLQLSVCIDMLFVELEFLDRVDAVAASGIPALEIWGWTNRDVQGLAERQRRHGLAVACVSSYRPGLDLVGPDKGNALGRAIRETASVAHRLGCRCLNTLAGDPTNRPHLRRPIRFGDPIADDSRRAKHDNLVANLRAGAPVAEGEGVVLCLEPLNNLVDHAGYYLFSSAEGFEVVHEVDSPAVKLLFDVYHQQVSEGNVTANLTAEADLIGHLHLADVPSRHQPGTGELNVHHLLLAARRAGYDGFVGLEYAPIGDPTTSLSHIRQVIAAVNDAPTARA